MGPWGGSQMFSGVRRLWTKCLYFLAIHKIRRLLFPHVAYGPIIYDPFKYPERTSICGLYLALRISLASSIITKYPRLLKIYAYIYIYIYFFFCPRMDHIKTRKKFNPRRIMMEIPALKDPIEPKSPKIQPKQPRTQRLQFRSHRFWMHHRMFCDWPEEFFKLDFSKDANTCTIKQKD